MSSPRLTPYRRSWPRRWPSASSEPPACPAGWRGRPPRTRRTAACAGGDRSCTGTPCAGRWRAPRRRRRTHGRSPRGTGSGARPRRVRRPSPSPARGGSRRPRTRPGAPRPRRARLAVLHAVGRRLVQVVLDGGRKRLAVPDRSVRVLERVVARGAVVRELLLQLVDDAGAVGPALLVVAAGTGRGSLGRAPVDEVVLRLLRVLLRVRVVL